jgi:lipoprotein-anchoring transpeptidase ErfK/SrfK
MGTTPTPTPVPTNHGRWIVISLPQHTMTVKQDDVVAKEITEFSTGRQGHLTPLLQDVQIDPNRRYKTHYSSLYNDKSGHGAAMPYALFFSGGCAFHAGDPDTESHGCVHLEMADAEWLFDWVGSNEVHVQINGPRPAGPSIGHE